MPKPFYITTTLPYVNAQPHVGFAMELVRADSIARWKKSQGFEVFFNTGTDEHGQKLFISAKEAGKDVKEYVDEFAESFKKLPKALGVTEDIHFVRTTDSSHVKAAQEFWKRCFDNGYIYKKNYEVKYCVGCELEKTDSELVDGRCPLHSNREIELISEENYFFKFSTFGEKLIALYAANPHFVIPSFRYNEIKSFVARGLEDFSISRLKSKMSWGVPVPGDSDHVMYVWFDALVSYISTLGWPENVDQFVTFWQDGTPVQYAGKDNLRQQSAMWQAMLMAAELPNSHTIVINGFVTGSGGVKMSKSLGNVIDPYDVVSEYSTDALRYFVLREVSSFEDSPFTMDRFKDAYNANLANGLGNLVSRIMKMAETNLPNTPVLPELVIPEEISEAVESFELQKAMDAVWTRISMLDSRIQDTQPFKLVKTDKEKGIEIISSLVIDLHAVAGILAYFLPDTSAKIIELIKENKSPTTPLFARKE